MTKIHIPPAALEAGARAIEKSLRTARLTLESEDGCKPEARAAFVAMVEAWPGVDTIMLPRMTKPGHFMPQNYIRLPMPQEGGDE